MKEEEKRGTETYADFNFISELSMKENLRVFIFPSYETSSDNFFNMHTIFGNHITCTFIMRNWKFLNGYAHCSYTVHY